MQNSVTNSSLNIDMIHFSRVFLMQVMMVQVLVGIFFCVNCLMIFTFLKKEMFREDTRYILFAQTLFVDSFLMVLSDVMLLWNYYKYPIHMIPCIVICTIVNILTMCTPLTLVAMCLERYVAICMPLRHADISTSRTRLFGFLIIWGISSIAPLFTFISYLSVVHPSALFSYALCSVEVMFGEEWQTQTRIILYQLVFFFMIIIIVFIYIKIMTAARASADKKKLTNKSLRTVILHAFQLFLCIMQFLYTYIEMACSKIDVYMYAYFKLATFLMFFIAPRCLSPLIYGLRDEKFFYVLKHHALCGFDSFCQTHSISPSTGEEYLCRSEAAPSGRYSSKWAVQLQVGGTASIGPYNSKWVVQLQVGRTAPIEVGTGLLLVQDNVRLHLTKICSQFLDDDDEGSDVIDWDSFSPDMNPIKNLWDIVTVHLDSVGARHCPEPRSRSGRRPLGNYPPSHQEYTQTLSEVHAGRLVGVLATELHRIAVMKFR
ncbi:odorant receptor 131-2-like [Hoplias malabaricus]|uniref:odorant receptor 131-2-like n=1 Tax=Hoplias malabaricus TaxID=27720 RepID=UPI0034621F59